MLNRIVKKQTITLKMLVKNTLMLSLLLQDHFVAKWFIVRFFFPIPI